MNPVPGNPPIQQSINPLIQSNALEVEDVVPWPEPVYGVALLDELAATLTRFVILPPHAATALALWIVHTYAFRLRDVTTYIGIESPEKQCGKTTLLAVLNELVNRAIAASNVSPPAFFRVIEDLSPTLLIDEGDTFLKGNDQLRGILTSGYKKKTAFVLRAGPAAGSPSPRGPRSAQWFPDLGHPSGGGVGNSLGRGEGDRHVRTTAAIEDEEPTTPESIGQVTRFSCWCPKVIATIGHLPETLADRCILIRMQRKTPREKCARLRELVPLPLKQKCARFVLDSARQVAAAQPALPPELSDRGAEIWEPLLLLADLAGNKWPELARSAAVGLGVAAHQSSPIASLLLDIFVLFVECKVERIFTRTLLEGLNTRFADRPWMELRNEKQRNEVWLAQQLRPFGIGPRTLRIEGKLGKGYLLEDFRETFRRYITKADLELLKASEEAR